MNQPLTTFWRTLTHFDRKQINLWMGFRNALGISLPLAVGVGLGYPSSGLVAATGALNVAAADGEDSYRKRGARMLTSSVIGAAAVWIGALSARIDMPGRVLGLRRRIDGLSRDRRRRHRHDQPGCFYHLQRAKHDAESRRLVRINRSRRGLAADRAFHRFVAFSWRTSGTPCDRRFLQRVGTLRHHRA